MANAPETMIPKWMKEIDKSNLIPGEIYNIYKCKKCILHHPVDMLRKGRRFNIMKNGISKTHTGCACPEKTPFLLKYKKCRWCGTEVYGKSISKGRCYHCNGKAMYDKEDEIMKKEVKSKPIKIYKNYYRRGEKIKSHIDLSQYSAWDCINRDKCLEITFKKGGANFKLGCFRCPYYVKSSL